MQTTQDRRAIALLLVTCVFAYTYFFQGDGWTLQSHFATIRSLVERRTFQISPSFAETGDVASIDGRSYSNKPPGLALLGAIPYALMAGIEQALGRDASSRNVLLANQYFLTVLLCAVPATTVVVMLYRWFRRDGAEPRMAFALAGSFALGSLFWPYAGMMFNHLLVAVLLFGAWLAIQRCASALLIGVLLGIAGLTDYLVWPLIPVFIALEWTSNRQSKRAGAELVIALVALAGLLGYQRAIFGSALWPSYVYDNPMFQQSGALFGKLHWPQLGPLYDVTLHRKRGLLVLCPIFVIPFLARPRFDRARIVAIAIVAYFIVFTMCYAYWLGGWGVGVRFLIPALPFAFIFARAGFERFPRTCAVLVAISILNMLAITAVRAHFPAGLSDLNEGANPLVACYRSLLHGDVAQGRDAFNLAMLLGVRGWWSLIPLLIVLVEVALLVNRYHRAGETHKR